MPTPADRDALRTQEVLEELRDERARQRAVYGNDHDDHHPTSVLAGEAVDRIYHAGNGPIPETRRRLIQAAAILVAAVESMDRRP